MTRGTPPSDWVAYVVVLGTVAAMMYGKYLIGRGDKITTDESIEEEHYFEEHPDEVEKK